MINDKLERYFNSAIKDANTRKHEYLSFELVFKYLLKDQAVDQVLSLCGADLGEIQNELEDYLKDDKNFSLLSKEALEELGKLQFQDEEIKKIAREDGIYYHFVA